MDDSVQIIDDVPDDDEVIIIDNPHPKPPAPVVILYDSDDDNDDDSNKNKETEKKDTSPGNTNNDVDRVGSDDSSCIRVNDVMMNDKKRQMKNWYEQYRNVNSVTTKGPRYYKCPECLAAFSSVYMIDRHIQSRHPTSIHRFKRDGNPSIVHILSDSESTPPRRSYETRSKISHNDKLSTTTNDSNTTSKLKLSPLTVREKGKVPVTSDKAKNIHSDLYIPLELSPRSSRDFQCESISNNSTSDSVNNATNSAGLSSIPRSSSVASSTTSTSSKQTSLPPLARIKPLPTTSQSFTVNRKPLSVMIFSPKNNNTQERMVTVTSSDENMNIDILKTVHERLQDRVVELIPSKNDSRPRFSRMAKTRSKYSNSKEHNTETNSDSKNNKNKQDNSSSNNDCRLQSNMVVSSNDGLQTTIVNNYTENKSDDGQNTMDALSDDNQQGMGNSSAITIPSLFDENVNKKRKKDPLLLLTEDVHSVPEKRLKGDHTNRIQANIAEIKRFICEYCNKRFSTLMGKKSHKNDKHSNNKKKASDTPLILHPSNPPTLDKLRSMKHIIMIDVDNWRKIFESDSKFSPSTFVWAFHGGSTFWRPSQSSLLLRHLQQMNCFYLHPKCGNSKDAADFALCVQAGKLDVQLPKEIPFTVLSGDKGFTELQNQLKLSKREVHIVDPHNKSIDTVLSMLNSIVDT